MEYLPYRRVYSNGIDEVIYNEIAKLLKKNTSYEKVKDKLRGNEWLYDIHWYLDEGDGKGEKEINNDHPKKYPVDQYCPTGFPLAVECEWKEIEAEIKFDFQKLLFCNADLRLMIFRRREFKNIGSLSEYFIRAIEKYPKLCRGSRFAFVVFLEESGSIMYSTYRKENDCILE